MAYQAVKSMAYEREAVGRAASIQNNSDLPQ
jgi:hypothetical protein